MREIKFRVWDTKKIFYPDSLMFNEDGSVGCCFQHNNTPEGMANERGIIAYEGKCTLMQYTGLKDKNGKEIYEGDIIKVPFHDGIQEYNSEIKWGEIGWEGYFAGEVIGNIWDNPELKI